MFSFYHFFKSFFFPAVICSAFKWLLFLLPLVACHSIQSLSHNESSKGDFSKNAKSVGVKDLFFFHEGFFIMLYIHEKKIGVARDHLAKLLRVSNAHSHLSLKDYSLQLVLTLSLKQVPHLFSPTLLLHIKNVGGKCFFLKKNCATYSKNATD